MTTRLEACDDGNFIVHGDLDFHSIIKLWQDSDKLFSANTPIEKSSQNKSLQNKPLQINLAQVNRCDSSGVALLVDWLRQARDRGQELKFVNIPAQMQAIIRVTDLEELLPFA